MPILKRFREGFAEANYGVLGVELFLVIAGILIAFQIDRWADERRDREQEHHHIDEGLAVDLYHDLKTDD